MADKKYFILTPQIVLAMCRTPQDYTLWSVVMMVAGAEGVCKLNTDQLATLAMMSAGKVSDSRSYLIAAGLINGEIIHDPGEAQPVWNLTIPKSIWRANADWRKERDKLLLRIAEKKQFTQALKDSGIMRKFDPDKHKRFHNVKPSQCEGGELSQYEGEPSQYETKKNHEEEPYKTTTPRAHAHEEPVEDDLSDLPHLKDRADKRKQDKEWGEIWTLYQNNIGGASPITVEEIQDVYDDLTPPPGETRYDWFKAAISQACAANSRKWSYIRGGLSGIQNSGSLAADKANWEQRNGRQNGTHNEQARTDRGKQKATSKAGGSVAKQYDEANPDFDDVVSGFAVT